VSKRKPKGGFNTPFAGVSLPPPAEPAPETPPVALVDASDERTDAELFAAAVGGANPLRDERGRVEPAKRSESELPDDEQLALLELQELVDGKGAFEISESEEDMSGRAPGVSHDILERLRGGQFSFRHHIDLHGFTRDEAKIEVVRFISKARKNGERCVLVVTGRGRSSPQGIAVLRQTMPRWLSRAPLSAHVLAFCSARNVDGGPGAF